MEDDIDSGQDVAPICEATPGASVSLFDHLPSIADKDKLHSSPEPALRDVGVAIPLIVICISLLV